MASEQQGISADAVLAELGSVRESIGKLASAYETIAKAESDCRAAIHKTLYGPDGTGGLVDSVRLLKESDGRRKRIEAWVGRAVMALVIPAVLYLGAKVWEVLKKIL